MEPRSSASVRLAHVALSHGRHQVVHGVDLAFEPGVTALVGPNGAGKSTVLRAIATLHPTASGHLEIGGRPVETEGDARQARRHLGYLEQDPAFPERFTVVDAIAYAAWLHRLPAAGGAAEEVVARFGLEAVATTQLRALSGGTRRRALLAQAVVHDPQVLVLDEPTVGMDIEHRATLCADLRALAADRVVVLSTHLIDDLVGLVTVAVTTRQPPPLRMVLSLPPALAILGAAAAVGLAVGYRWSSRALAPLVGLATFGVLLAGHMTGPVHIVKVGGATASLLGLAPRPEVQAGQVLQFTGVAVVAVAWVAGIGPRRGLPTLVRVGGAVALLASGVAVLHLAGNQEFDHVSVPMVCEGRQPEICVDAGYRRTIPELRASFAPSFRSLEAASLPAPDALVQLPMGDKPGAAVFDPVTMLRYPYFGDGYLASSYIPDGCDIFVNDRAGDAFEGLSLYLQRTYGQTDVTVTPEERFLLHLAYENLVECRP